MMFKTILDQSEDAMKLDCEFRYVNDDESGVFSDRVGILPRRGDQICFKDSPFIYKVVKIRIEVTGEIKDHCIIWIEQQERIDENE
jgi:hypothetical protein